MSAPNPPVILTIIDSMQTALRSISKSAGYFNDVARGSVVKDPVVAETIPDTSVPFLICGHRCDPVSREFTGSRPSSVLDHWRITIEGRIDVPEVGDEFENADRKVKALAEIEADIEVALTRDVTRGGYAKYTYVLQATKFITLPGNIVCLFEQPVEILLQRTYGTPGVES